MILDLWGKKVLEQQRKMALLMSLFTLGLFFSGLFVFLTPLPFIYYRLKYKEISYQALFWPSFLIVVVIYALGLSYFHTLFQEHPKAYWLLPIPFIELKDYFSNGMVVLVGISYYLLFLVMSLSIAQVLSVTPKQVFKKICFSISILFLGSLVVALALILPHLTTFVASYQKATHELLEQFIAAQQAGLSFDQVVSFKSMMEDYVSNSVYLLPFGLFLVVTFLYVLNLMLAKRFFGIYLPAIRKYNLSLFKIPFVFVWGVLGSALVMIANELLFSFDVLFYMALNLLLALAVVNLFQGIAVLVFLLNKRKIFGFMRLLAFLILVMLGEVSLYLLALTGFADNWIDLRKVENKSA